MSPRDDFREFYQVSNTAKTSRYQAIILFLFLFLFYFCARCPTRIRPVAARRLFWANSQKSAPWCVYYIKSVSNDFWEFFFVVRCSQRRCVSSARHCQQVLILFKNFVCQLRCSHRRCMSSARHCQQVLIFKSHHTVCVCVCVCPGRLYVYLCTLPTGVENLQWYFVWCVCVCARARARAQGVYMYICVHCQQV